MIQEVAALTEIIMERIKNEGPLTFEQFMEMALYYPQLGYYASQREKIGPEGDFYTSPDVHPVFGKVIAEQLAEMWNYLGQPGGYDLVEYGAGKGLLARDILNHLEDKYPDVFRIVTYYIIEASPFFIIKQQEILTQSGFPLDKVQWVENPAQINRGKGITGAFLSNELVDALPFHRVRSREDGVLKEIYIDYGRDGFQEIEGPLSSRELSRYFDEEGIILQPGQSAEVNLRSRDWLQAIATNLLRGFVVTIDYGDVAEKLYNASRFDGTMRCFQRHRLVDSPYQDIGSQDITASVNFSSLRRWGSEFGLLSTGPIRQADFLINAGILELAGGRDDFNHDKNRMNTVNAVKKLILPGGLGSLFRVFIQCKGFTEMPPLKGITRRFGRL